MFTRIVLDECYLFSSNGYALGALWSLLWQQTTDYVTNVNSGIEQFATAAGIIMQHKILYDHG